MDTICVNDSYPNDTLKFWKEHGVVFPELNHIDQIREVVKHSNGSIGLRLEGIKNPDIPIVHPILNTVMMEVSFSIKRFRTLQGNEINYEQIKNKILV